MSTEGVLGTCCDCSNPGNNWTKSASATAQIAGTGNFHGVIFADEFRIDDTNANAGQWIGGASLSAGDLVKRRELVSPWYPDDAAALGIDRVYNTTFYQCILAGGSGDPAADHTHFSVANIFGGRPPWLPGGAVATIANGAWLGTPPATIATGQMVNSDGWDGGSGWVFAPASYQTNADIDTASYDVAHFAGPTSGWAVYSPAMTVPGIFFGPRYRYGSWNENTVWKQGAFTQPSDTVYGANPSAYSFYGMPQIEDGGASRTYSFGGFCGEVSADIEGEPLIKKIHRNLVGAFEDEQFYELPQWPAGASAASGGSGPGNIYVVVYGLNDIEFSDTSMTLHYAYAVVWPHAPGLSAYGSRWTVDQTISVGGARDGNAVPGIVDGMLAGIDLSPLAPGVGVTISQDCSGVAGTVFGSAAPASGTTGGSVACTKSKFRIKWQPPWHIQVIGGACTNGADDDEHEYGPDAIRIGVFGSNC